MPGLPPVGTQGVLTGPPRSAPHRLQSRLPLGPASAPSGVKSESTLYRPGPKLGFADSAKTGRTLSESVDSLQRFGTSVQKYLVLKCLAEDEFLSERTDLGGESSPFRRLQKAPLPDSQSGSGSVQYSTPGKEDLGPRVPESSPTPPPTGRVCQDPPPRRWSGKAPLHRGVSGV